MPAVSFTVERLKKLPRPEGYLDDLRACAQDPNSDPLTFDTDSDCYRKLLKKYRPTQHSRGLGDTVANLTKKIGIQPCEGCKKRQELFNKLIPYPQGP